MIDLKQAPPQETSIDNCSCSPRYKPDCAYMKGGYCIDPNAVPAAPSPQEMPTDSELLGVLNAARVALKSRDQSTFEAKVLDGLKVVISKLEASQGKSLNEQAKDHPRYDNPRDPFASPDRLPPLAGGPDDDAMIERVENILRSPKTISYPSAVAAEYVREQMQELLTAYLRLREQTGRGQCATSQTPQIDF
jgi:hypothetical protein